MKKENIAVDETTVENKMTALVKSSCSKYYTCNVGVNDKFVSMKISSPVVSICKNSEEIIKQLNDSGDLTYHLYLDDGKLYVSKAFEKMSDTPTESIIEVISNMMANLDTALMALTK